MLAGGVGGSGPVEREWGREEEGAAHLLIATRDNSFPFVCHFPFIRGLAAPPAPPGCWPGSDRISPPPAGKPTAYPSI